MRSHAPLRTAALAGALFVYLTAEMFPIGVLGDLTSDLRTTESGTGLMLTVYALVAGAAILPTVALTRRLDRRIVLVASLLVLAVSQTALAVAPNLAAALAARAIAAVPHGLLWSTVPIVAVSLAPEGRQGRATAHVFVGGSLALVGGAPLMTGLASWVEWRTAAGVLALLALLLAALLWAILPRELPDEQTSEVTPRSPLWPAQVVKVCAITAFVVTASYVPYTFFAVLAGPYGFQSWSLGCLQAAFGGAGLLAVAIVGRLIDRSADTALVLTVAGLVAAFGVVALRPSLPVFVGGVVVWGAALACVAPTLQTMALRCDPGAHVMASALYVLAFQVGISAGSALGGVVLDGAGARWLPVYALAGLTPVAAVLLVQSVLVHRRRVRGGRAPQAQRSRTHMSS